MSEYPCPEPGKAIICPYHGDFGQYEGEIPETGTILDFYVKKMWWTRVQRIAAEPMFGEQWMAEAESGSICPDSGEDPDEVYATQQAEGLADSDLDPEWPGHGE
jgi:hypothetical protein